MENKRDQRTQQILNAYFPKELSILITAYATYPPPREHKTISRYRDGDWSAARECREFWSANFGDLIHVENKYEDSIRTYAVLPGEYEEGYCPGDDWSRAAAFRPEKIYHWLAQAGLPYDFYDDCCFYNICLTIGIWDLIGGVYYQRIYMKKRYYNEVVRTYHSTAWEKLPFKRLHMKTLYDDPKYEMVIEVLE